MREVMIGRWSEDNSWTVCQEILVAMLGEANVMSGDVCCVSML